MKLLKYFWVIDLAAALYVISYFVNALMGGTFNPGAAGRAAGAALLLAIMHYIINRSISDVGNL